MQATLPANDPASNSAPPAPCVTTQGFVPVQAIDAPQGLPLDQGATSPALFWPLPYGTCRVSSGGATDGANAPVDGVILGGPQSSSPPGVPSGPVQFSFAAVGSPNSAPKPGGKKGGGKGGGQGKGQVHVPQLPLGGTPGPAGQPATPVATVPMPGTPGNQVVASMSHAPTVLPPKQGPAGNPSNGNPKNKPPKPAAQVQASVAQSQVAAIQGSVTNPAPKPGAVPLHGHPVLAQSRHAAYQRLHQAWIHKLGEVLSAGSGNVLLYDIGGGRMGLESLHVLLPRIVSAAGPNACRVFAHVSTPAAASGDLGRSSSIRPALDKLNSVATNESKNVTTGCVNFCEHRLGDCTCTAGFGTVLPISVHSLYYIQEWEWVAFAERVGGSVEVACAIHRPSESGLIPADTPEFIWLSAKEAPQFYGWHERLLSGVRRILLNDPVVTMAPLGQAGTVYQHPVCNWLQFGGKHISPFSAAVDHWTRDWNQFVLFLMMVMVLVSTALLWWWAVTDAFEYVWNVINYMHSFYRFHARYHFLLDFPGGWIPYRLLKWWMCRTPEFNYFPFSLLCLQVLLVVFGVVSSRWIVHSSRDPGLFTTHTITFTHRSSLGPDGGDPLVDILDLVVGAPRPLEPFSFGDVTVEPELFRQALTILLSSEGMSRAADRTTASLLRRYHYSISRTTASVNLALSKAGLIRSGNEASGSGSGSTPPSLPQSSGRMRSALGQLTVNVWPRTVAFFLIKGVLLYALAQTVLPSGASGWWV